MTESSVSDVPVDENLEILNLEGIGPVVTLRQIVLIMQGMKVQTPVLATTVGWIEELDRLTRTCAPVMLAPNATVVRNNLKQVDVPVARTVEDVPGEEVIRIEISGKGLGNPRRAAELSDLLYGIDDGQVDGSVKILD